MPGKRSRAPRVADVTTDRESAVPSRNNRSSLRTSPYWVHRRHAGIVSRGLAFILDLLLIISTSTLIFYLTSSTLALIGISFNSCTAWQPIRVSGTLIDNLCWMIRGSTVLLSLAVAPTFFLLGWLLGGQTVGMMIAGVRVVRTDGSPLKPRTAVLRLVALVGSLLLLGVGLLWAVIDSERQGWHDKLARTYVIYWRREVAHREMFGYSPPRRMRKRAPTVPKPADPPTE